MRNQIIVTEQSINREMIPRPNATGCPVGTFNSLYTCFCEDHCSWETCRLSHPPQNCLSKIIGEAVWAWDSGSDAWVAQGTFQGYSCNILSFIFVNRNSGAENLFLFFLVLTLCTNGFTVDSNGITKEYNPEVLGKYNYIQISNERRSFKHFNDSLYLHRTLDNLWTVC